MPAESRTPDTQIKSLLLYLLSYGHIYGLLSRKSPSFTKKFLDDIAVFLASARLEQSDTGVNCGDSLCVCHNGISFLVF